MIHGVHIEVLLAGGYALLLVGVAVILEFVARHAHQSLGTFPQLRFRLQKANGRVAMSDRAFT